MNPKNKVQTARQSRPNGLARLLKKVAGKITALFAPEEVEVTFKGEGKKMSYTYKIMHKQVA